MHNKKDKAAILDKIAAYYKLNSKAELARFFEVKPQTISSWYKRNSLDYDLIFEKCKEMNLNELFKQNNKNEVNDANHDYEKKSGFQARLEQMIERKDEKIMELSEKIGELRAELKRLKQHD